MSAIPPTPPPLTLHPGCWPPGTAELVRRLANCRNVSQVLVLVQGDFREPARIEFPPRQAQ